MLSRGTWLAALLLTVVVALTLLRNATRPVT
jgi:hypothetical protein